VKTWIRWLLLALSIGGGFEGIALNFQFLSLPEFKQPVYVALIGISIILYGFVFVSGLLFADDPNCSAPLLISLCLQIPTISSPILVYRFLSGFPFVLSVTGGKLNTMVRVGGEWQFNLFQELPWEGGINLCALISLILLIRYRRRNLPDPLESHKTGLKFWNFVVSGSKAK